MSQFQLNEKLHYSMFWNAMGDLAVQPPNSFSHLSCAGHNNGYWLNTNLLIKGLNYLYFYSRRQIFSNGLSCRLPVVLTNGVTFQNGNWNVRLHRGRRKGNEQNCEHIVTATLNWSNPKFTCLCVKSTEMRRV